MSVAKKIRLGKILKGESKRSLIVPIDHGLTLGPIAGLESSLKMTNWLSNDRIDAIIAHKGMIVRLAERDLLNRRGVILHLNGMNALAPFPDDKEMLTSLEAAARLGADGVSVQINFADGNDAANWKLLGRVVDEAQIYGFPVLTMLYDKTISESPKQAIARLRQLLRVAVELGTDAIKIGMPEKTEYLAQILDSIKDDALIFLAGGEVGQPEKLLLQIDRAIRLGVAGVCVGRNVFANPNSESFLRQLAGIIHREISTSSVRREVVHAY